MIKKHIGSRFNKGKEKVQVSFELTSTPGYQAKVTLTQVRVCDNAR